MASSIFTCPIISAFLVLKKAVLSKTGKKVKNLKKKLAKFRKVTIMRFRLDGLFFLYVLGFCEADVNFISLQFIFTKTASKG